MKQSKSLVLSVSYVVTGIAFVLLGTGADSAVERVCFFVAAGGMFLSALGFAYGRLQRKRVS